MTWDVEYTDEFGGWWASLTEDEQASVAASVQLLEVRGAALGHGWRTGSDCAVSRRLGQDQQLYRARRCQPALITGG